MEYFAPATLKEAENLKKKAGRGGVYLAGGTILNWKKSPGAESLIDLKNLGLRYVKASGSGVTLGAMATVQEIAEHKQLPLALVTAAANFSSRNIRNMATVGGSVAGKFFVSDLLPVLLSFKAKVEFFVDGKKKTQALESWLKARPGILCSLVIDRPERLVKVRQEKISGIDFPMVVTAVGWEARDGLIADAIVAISGASARTQVLRSAARYLEGRGIRNVDFAGLIKLVQREVEVTDNIKAPVRVKRGFIESNLKGILGEYKRAAR